MEERFKDQQVTANGNTWRISGKIIRGNKGQFKVVATVINGDVYDKEGLEEAIQNFAIDRGCI